MAIIVFQILMIGVCGLKDNAAVSILSIPPLAFTIIFKIVIMLYFERVSKPMEMDNEEEKSEEAEEEAQEEADEEFLQVKLTGTFLTFREELRTLRRMTNFPKMSLSRFHCVVSSTFNDLGEKLHAHEVKPRIK